MKKFMIVLAMLVALFGVNGSNLLAGEHGGKEHGGEVHKDAMMEGSHGMVEDHMATLKEAAQVLKQEGHADLAKKLEDMAKM